MVYDAVFDNVFAHTPDGTAFAVRVAITDATARVEIADSGPGFPTDPHTLLDRGTSGKGSTGLGLDIARRAVRRAGGELEIAAPRSGASIVLVLPLDTAGSV